MGLASARLSEPFLWGLGMLVAARRPIKTVAHAIVVTIAFLISVATPLRAEVDGQKTLPSYDLVEVCFVTDRQPLLDRTDRKRTISAFSNVRSEDLTYGCHQVSYPLNSPLGAFAIAPVGADGLIDLSHRDTHYALYSSEILGRAAFKDRAHVARSSDGLPAIVYVHGYATTHEEAVLHAAQVWNDTSRQFSIFVFDWTSEGVEFGYVHDLDSAQNAIDSFLTFLEDLGTSSTGKINILCHSMGGRLVLSALDIATRDLQHQTLLKRVNGLLLAAPAIDLDNFKRIIEKLDGHIQNITVYCSQEDAALQIGSAVHDRELAGYCGHGQNNQPILFRTALDLVDVTALSKCGSVITLRARFVLSCLHAQYRVNSHLLQDMTLYFAGATHPSNRGNLFVHIWTLRLVKFWRARSTSNHYPQ